MTSLTAIPFKKRRKSAPRLSKPYVPGKHAPRFWTDAEKEIVQSCYPTGGVAACLARLPSHRTPSGVYRQATLLGLRFGPTPAPRQNPSETFGTPEMDAVLRDRWPLLRGKGAVSALAAELQIPRWWLSQRALKLGLTIPHRKEPTWTPSEVALLNKMPLHNPNRCAKIFREHGFRRTPTAILLKAKRQGLSQRAARSTLSGNQAAQLLGMDNKTVTQYCVSGALKSTRRGTRRLPQQGGDVWDIQPRDLKQFILDNLDRIDIRKVEKFAFVDLLTRTFDHNDT